MKGLLVTLTPKGAFDHLEDLGAAYVAGYLNHNGVKCRFLQLYDELFDAARCANSRFDFVLFTLYNVTKKKVYEACEVIRENAPDTKIIVGGAEVTVNRKLILEECSCIDYAVKGEGEITTYELVRAIEKNEKVDEIPGVLYRKDGEIIENNDRELVADITSLPWPDRAYLKDKKLTVASITTSRGCKGNCAFCMTHDIWPIWRGREVFDMIDEIKYLYHNYEVDCINFTDASFEDPDIHCERMNQILDGILSLDFKIYFSVDFRAEFISKCTDEILQKLIAAGLSRVVVGIEAANEYDLRLYGKRATLQQNYEIADFFMKAHIPFYPGFINFNPYSSVKTIEENLKFFERFKLGGRITLFATELSVFKGSRIYERVQKDGLLDSEDGAWHYKYPGMKKLLGFVQDEINKLNRNGIHVIQEIDSNLEKADVLSYVLKQRITYLNEKDKESIEEIFDEFSKNFVAIREKLNVLCIQWYKKLLEYTEKENYEGYEKVTQKFQIEEIIIQSAQKLRKNMLHLFKQLAVKGYMINVKF